MELLLYIVIFVLGLCIGSFANVCIYRIPNEQSVAFPPSHCTNCGERIKKRDLIPIISYIFLSGKCRNCSNKISIRYPLIELLVGMIFLLLFLNFGITIKFVLYSIISTILIIIFFIDLEHMIIPDGLNLLLGLIGITFNILYPKDGYISTLLSMLYGFLLGGGIFFLLALFGGMGGGDIKIMAALGLLFGWKLTIPLMALSFLLGGVVGVILLCMRSRGMKDKIPFGPFIAAGALIVILYGNNLISWYLTYYIF